MSCRELERLFVAGSTDLEALAHRASCRLCEALGADLDRLGRIVAGLHPPVGSQALQQALLLVPERTVSCEGADRLIVLAAENELAPEERGRLQSHLSRCEACTQATETLLAIRELSPPEAAPWLGGRLAGLSIARERQARPRRRERSASRWLLDPKTAIGLAYAAAVAVMLLGFNPADLARKSGVARLEESTKATMNVAGTSLVDHIGALQEKTLRALAVWRGRAGGYGRAALSTAIDLVMRSEPQRPANPRRNRQEKGTLQKNETAVATWHA